MIFWCQGCGEQHTPPHVTQANITSCAKCGGSHFATWQPVRSALSQEAVRDEVLAEVILVCDAYASEGDKTAKEYVHETVAELAARFRALKREPNASQERSDHDMVGSHLREPNAATQASGSSEHTVASANPAPAAPDVAEMVKRLRNYANESGGAQVEQDLLEAAALLELLGQRARSPAPLARLGQGWILVSERLPEGDGQVLVTYNTGGADVLTRQAVRNLYEAAEIEGDGECFITHWMPLPPAPGASDD